MSQLVRTSNQHPLVAAAAVAQVPDLAPSSSANCNTERPLLLRPLKTKAPEECLRDDEENESRREVTKMPDMSSKRPDETVGTTVEENLVLEAVSVSRSQRKRPRLAVELDSESKQSRSLELSLLEALLPRKSK